MPWPRKTAQAALADSDLAQLWGPRRPMNKPGTISAFSREKFVKELGLFILEKKRLCKYMVSISLIEAGSDCSDRPRGQRSHGGKFRLKILQVFRKWGPTLQSENCVSEQRQESLLWGNALGHF